jgi:hypothetical protein
MTQMELQLQRAHIFTSMNEKYAELPSLFEAAHHHGMTKA